MWKNKSKHVLTIINNMKISSISHRKISLFWTSFFSLSLLWYKIVGKNLYDSAVKHRIPDLPAFALECLPNRNSLVYGDLYGIGKEAATVFRGTLRYEGMACVWHLSFLVNVWTCT